jgi:ion channel-forming bestrophin family protein
MIKYNPKEWFTFIFRLHKADTFRALGWMLFSICLYTLFIVVLEKEILKLSENSHAKNIIQMHTLIGMVISLLLVFRTNTAYDRWWEGRKALGTLLNNSRNLALKLSSIFSENDIENRTFFQTMIPAYAFSLKSHLQDVQVADELFDLDEHKHLITTLEETQHTPNQIVHQIFDKIDYLRLENKLSDLQILYINEELKSFTEVCGICERIKNTPIPFSYSIFLKKFVFFYVMTLPFGFVFTLGYLSIPIVAFIFYVLASLELIAEEIEDPFGNDPNDLPIGKICNSINKQVVEILGVN